MINHFKSTYVLFGLMVMVICPEISLMFNTLIFIATLAKYPSDFKIIKIEDLVKANLVLALAWISLFFYHGYLVIHYTQFPIESGQIFLIYPLSLYLLWYHGTEFPDYISHNVFQTTLDIFRVVHDLFGPFSFILG